MNIKLDININLQNVDSLIKSIQNIINVPNINNTKIENLKTIVSSNESENLEITKQQSHITILHINNLMSELSQNGRLVEIKETLAKYNVKRTSQLKEENLESIYKDLKKLLSN